MHYDFDFEIIGSARPFERVEMMVDHVKQINEAIGSKGLEKITYYPNDYYSDIYINTYDFEQENSSNNFNPGDVIQLLDSKSLGYKAFFDSNFENENAIFSIKRNR